MKVFSYEERRSQKGEVLKNILNFSSYEILYMDKDKAIIREEREGEKLYYRVEIKSKNKCFHQETFTTLFLKLICIKKRENGSL